MAPCCLGKLSSATERSWSPSLSSNMASVMRLMTVEMNDPEIRSSDGSPRTACCMSVNPAWSESVSCLSSDASTSSSRSFQAPDVMRLVCLPSSDCFFNVRLSYKQRVPFWLPMASSGAFAAHLINVKTSPLSIRAFVSTDDSVFMLASHSRIIAEFCCRMASFSPSTSHSS